MAIAEGIRLKKGGVVHGSLSANSFIKKSEQVMQNVLLSKD
jgi:hypothetical protein